MGHKRKRQAEDSQETLPPSKLQVVSDNQPQTAAGRRQERSERKSKKPKAVRVRAPKDSTSGPRLHSGDVDTLADGHDFVPLNDSATREDTNGVDKKKKTSKQGSQDPQRQRQEKSKANLQDTSAQREKAPGTSSARFICFVGNLPFSATVEQIQEHFKKLEPRVRLSTNKETGKGRGFAFLEFDSYDKMKTCLKTYHHSIFNPERDGVAEKDKRGSSDRGRKINVELTAGGGGKSGQRTDKIQAKNKKLEEERERRRIDEVKQEAKQRKAKTGTTVAQDAASHDRGDVHPSRLARVQS